MKKSVICFLTWNRFNYTKKSIKTLLENTDRDKYELILWDNGSTEEKMLEWLKEQCLENNFYYLFFRKNQGLTRAMNNQMFIMNRILKEQISFFCHIANDILVPKKWLEACEEAFKIEKVGLLGLNLEEDYNFELENFNNFNLEKIRENGNIGGAHFCIPKKIFDKIGYFRHVNFGYGQQDANYTLEVKILPENFGCYYLPIKEFHGEDLSKTEKLYKDYQNTMEQRLRSSGSDSSGGRNYRTFLQNFKKEFNNKKIDYETFVNTIKNNKNFIPIDRSQLIETNIDSDLLD